MFRTLRKLAKNYIKHQTERNTSKKFLLKIQNEFLFAFPLILQHSKHLWSRIFKIFWFVLQSFSFYNFFLKISKEKAPWIENSKTFFLGRHKSIFFSKQNSRLEEVIFFLWWNFQKENAAAAVEQRVEWSFDKKNCCNSLFMVHQMGKWEWRQGDGWGKIGEGK